MVAMIDGKSGIVMGVRVPVVSNEEIALRRARKEAMAKHVDVPVYKGVSKRTLLSWAREAGIGA